MQIRMSEQPKEKEPKYLSQGNTDKRSTFAFVWTNSELSLFIITDVDLQILEDKKNQWRN